MEMEAVVQERASLEAQLVSLRAQIDSLTAELEEQKAKVNTDTLTNYVVLKLPSHASLLLPLGIIMIKLNPNSI